MVALRQSTSHVYVTGTPEVRSRYICSSRRVQCRLAIGYQLQGRGARDTRNDQLQVTYSYNTELVRCLYLVF